MEKKNNYVSYWNETHKKYQTADLTYDDWLEKYENILNDKSKLVLDLGCGLGNDSLYLVKKGFNVLAADYSLVALESVKKNVKGVKTALIDLEKDFPLEDSSFDVVIADLSLHYFDSKTTFKIMNEIKRVLKQGGYLIARVNSIDDTNYGAKQGIKIENNYYFVDGYNKRFFDEEDIYKFFRTLGKVQTTKQTLKRYSKPKEVFEIVVRNEK